MTSYSALMSPSASCARAGVSAATIATASPTQRVTSPTAIMVGQSATTLPMWRLPGYVLPGCGDDHAGKRPGGRDVEGEEPGTGVRRAQHRTEEHAGFRQIVDVPGLAPDLHGCIDAEEPRTDSGTG